MAVLFFDIDGTLISDKTDRIPASTVEALAQARANGHYIFVNTGRTICALRSELKAIDFDGFLCGCGTYLTYHGEVLLRSSIEKERGKAIVKKMYECGMDGVLEGTENNYLSKKTSRFERIEGQRTYFDTYFPGIGRESYIEDGEFVYDKLFVHEDENSRTEEFFQYISEDLDIVDRGYGYELIQKGFSKWTACEFVMEKLGMSREEAYAFGDSTNDLAMFQYAAHAVAMGEHAKELEPYTEFVTKTVEEDGIAYALKHYGLI